MVREVFDRNAYDPDVIQPGLRRPLVDMDMATQRAA